MGAAETIKIQRSACLDLDTLKTIAWLQAGIYRLNYNESVHAQILDGYQSVRTPSQLEPLPGNQGCRYDGIIGEFF